MNTTKIYNAQLNVSEYYTIDAVKELINKLSYIGDDVYYNNATRSIDIDIPKGTISEFDDTLVRDELKIWLRELPANEEDIETVIENINCVFNITKIGSEKNDVVKLYLY